MRIDIYSARDLFIEHIKEIEEVLRAAVRKALMEHKQAGHAIAIWKNGKVEIIRPEEITIEPMVMTEQT